MVEAFRLSLRAFARIKEAEHFRCHTVHIQVHRFHISKQQCLDEIIVIIIPRKPVLNHIGKHDMHFFIGQRQVIIHAPCSFLKYSAGYFQITTGKKKAPDRILLRR